MNSLHDVSFFAYLKRNSIGIQMKIFVIFIGL
jgi:hypothetical protein